MLRVRRSLDLGAGDSAEAVWAICKMREKGEMTLVQRRTPQESLLYQESIGGCAGDCKGVPDARQPALAST